MNKKKLKKILERIRSLRTRSGAIKEQEVVAIAKKLGRRRAKAGSEPTYISDDLPGRLTIPSHRTLKLGTARSILDFLETDVFNWHDILARRATQDSHEPKN